MLPAEQWVSILPVSPPHHKAPTLFCRINCEILCGPLCFAIDSCLTVSNFLLLCAGCVLTSEWFIWESITKVLITARYWSPPIANLKSYFANRRSSAYCHCDKRGWQLVNPLFNTNWATAATAQHVRRMVCSWRCFFFDTGDIVSIEWKQKWSKSKRSRGKEGKSKPNVKNFCSQNTYVGIRSFESIL